MAASEIRNYTVKLGLDNSEFVKNIKSSGAAIDGIKTTIKAAAGALAGTQMFKTLVTDYYAYNANLSNSIQLMRYNVTETHAWGGLLKRVGGDTQSYINSLNNLTKGLDDVKWGTGALLEVSKKYGISFQKSNGQLMDSEELFNSLITQMQKYDRATRVAIGTQLGLDDSIMRAFEMGVPGIQKMIKEQKERNKVTQNDLDISTKYEDSLLALQESWAGMTKVISNKVLPILTEVFNIVAKMISFMTENNMVMPLFFMGGAVAAMPVLRTMTSMLRVGTGLLKVSSLMPAALLSSGKALGNINKGANVFLTIMKAIRVATWGAVTPLLLIFAKFIAIGVAIAAVFVIVQDLFYYFMGWDSVTGDLVEQYPILGTLLEPIKFVVNMIVDGFLRLLDFIMNPSWESFKKLFTDLYENVINGIMMSFENIKNAISYVIDGIKKIPFIGKFFGGSSAPEPTPSSAQIEAVAAANKTEISQNNYIKQTINANKPGAVKAETGEALNDNLKKMNIAAGTN